jgi:phosphoribosylformimino-5-aminoimidazole carboxamide ribotide isomerase
VTKIVIGSETLNDLDFVSKAIDVFGEDRVLISIDQKQGRILSTLSSIAMMDIVSFTQKLEDLGVHKIILLDLDRVGTELGINLDIIKPVLEKTGVEVLVGGGVTSLQELEKLRNLGVSASLVATILHNGRITVNELETVGFL